MRFVLLDRLTVIEPGVRAEAHKRFDAADPIFLDHFPGMPIVPGVLLTEAMGQTGGWLLAASTGFARWPLLTMIADAKFRRPVRPGETLRLTAEVRVSRDRACEVVTEAHVEATRVASARLLFHLFDVPTETAPDFERWARQTYGDLGGPALPEPVHA